MEAIIGQALLPESYGLARGIGGYWWWGMTQCGVSGRSQ